MLRKAIKLTIILIISVFIGNIAYGMYKEFRLDNEPNNKENNNQEIVYSNTFNSLDNENINDFEKIVQEYEGYKVSSKLTIPKINLDTYVFEEYSEEGMWICPTKYFGPAPNEIGNYCISAHNYNIKNMFNNIINLEKGDKIILTDNKNGQLEYVVYDVYKTQPDNVSPLSQDTDNNIELTLITCSDYSSKRIIVKARKI